VHQDTVLTSPARFRVVACARRFGKTMLGVMAITHRALRGERCWWLAPTHAQGQDVWRELKAATRELQGWMYINNSERRMEFPGGGVIEVKTANHPDNLRGKGLYFAVLDEAAFMDVRVWSEVVRPMLLTTEGDALFLSTPYGQNWFWTLYQRGLDPLADEWASFRYTIYDAPHIPPDEIESVRLESSERVWQQEFLAEFLADAGAVFRRVRDVMTLDPAAQVPKPDTRYVFGVDWGRDNDFTAIAVVDATAGKLVALDRFNQIGYTVQRERLKAMARHWQPKVIWAEANSIGTVNIENLQREGLPVRPFMTTARSKQPLIDNFAAAIEKHEIAMIADDVLQHELVSYQLDRLPGGGYRYSAPSGGHDDTVIAAALAWHGATSGGTEWLLL
jgi:phage FluMu gp28-like protein